MDSSNDQICSLAANSKVIEVVLIERSVADKTNDKKSQRKSESKKKEAENKRIVSNKVVVDDEMQRNMNQKKQKIGFLKPENNFNFFIS